MSNIYANKIHEIKTIKEPFDHFVIDNFIDIDLFKNIYDSIDNIDTLNVFTKSKGRFGLNFKDWSKHKYLNQIKKDIFNDEIRATLINKFSNQIKKKQPKSLDSNWNATLTYDNSAYEIQKHRDNNIKQVTFIFYIKGGVSGTILHKNFFNIINKEKDKRIEFKENRLLCFSSFINTWHSVEKPKTPQNRFTIQAYLEFSEEPYLKWTSNGYPNLFNKIKNKLIPRSKDKI